MPPQNKGITHEASMDVELYTQAIFELNFFLSMTTNVYFFSIIILRHLVLSNEYFVHVICVFKISLGFYHSLPS